MEIGTVDLAVRNVSEESINSNIPRTWEPENRFYRTATIKNQQNRLGKKKRGKLTDQQISISTSFSLGSLYFQIAK